MNMMRCVLLFCLLAFSVAVPASAQNVTGTLSTILDEEPSGSGWSAVVSDAQAQCSGNGHPLYHSTVLENQTFEGDYTPTRRMVLAIFSDDGSDVTVDGTKVFPPSGQTAGGQGQGQALDINALHKVGVTLEPNTTHHIKVDYSNIIYTGSGDIDGCTLFAYEKTTPYISLDTAQSPVTATFSSPNGIDASTLKFTFDGVDQTANTTHDGASLSYTVPNSVSFYASHAMRVEVKDNDNNLAVASVSAHVIIPLAPFDDTKTSTVVSYNLLGLDPVRVRVCLWATDTAVRTFTSPQRSGESSVTWDGKDDSGNQVQTGVYVFKVEKLSNGNWIRVADIDPITGVPIILNIDGARLSDTHTNPGSTQGGSERATKYPAIVLGKKLGSWTMVPLQQTSSTLLGTPVVLGMNNSTLDGFQYNQDPAGVRNENGKVPPAPDTYQGTLYWYVKDITRIRSLSKNASSQVMPYKLNADAYYDNSIPLVNITTGIAGNSVSQLSPNMAYHGKGAASTSTSQPGYIAVTFDDGPYNQFVPNSSENYQPPRDPSTNVLPPSVPATWDEAYTQDLLNLLPNFGASCTFFLNGIRVRQVNDNNTTTTQNILALGHELANHTYDHPVNMDNWYMSNPGIPAYADWIHYEVITTRLLERYVTNGGSETNYFRPPGGAGDGGPNIQSGTYPNDPDFWATLGEDGYYDIAWHKYPSDNYTKYPQTVADDGSGGTSGVVEQANDIIRDLESNPFANGDVVLMHNGRQHTILALQTVLNDLKKAGWKFVTVSQIQPIYQQSK